MAERPKEWILTLERQIVESGFLGEGNELLFYHLAGLGSAIRCMGGIRARAAAARRFPCISFTVDDLSCTENDMYSGK